ncbi:MFS transporter, partial [Rhizobium ruizarguesonis]
MSMTYKFMSRREVMGGTLAAAALHLVAQGQDERGSADPEATD